MASAYRAEYDPTVVKLATEQYESTVSLSAAEALKLAGQLVGAATAILDGTEQQQ